MKGRVVLKAEELEGVLTEADKSLLADIRSLYQKTMESYRILNTAEGKPAVTDKETQQIIDYYEKMGHLMKDFTQNEPNIKVYSFETPKNQHGEVSRLIAKLRDRKTARPEFVYYTQRAYELLFQLMLDVAGPVRKHHLIVKTPVTNPVQNYAVHKIPFVDDAIKDTVMCVLLRGALLPSMIISKEIQEYSSTEYITPFALFKIFRDDKKSRENMEYILDLDRSYFNPEMLDGKHLVFADPMNATGGSLITIMNYFKTIGIRPSSVSVLNVIAAVKGVFQIVRSIENVTCYTLWMDPYLNDAAYILPGLGDAGDRLNGPDEPDHHRNMIQLIGDYGQNLVSLYRSQVRKIEETILEP